MTNNINYDNIILTKERRYKMYENKRETICISLPENSKAILKEMSRARRITTSKLIEFLITGKEKINPDEWTQWENWFKIKEKK